MNRFLRHAGARGRMAGCWLVVAGLLLFAQSGCQRCEEGTRLPPPAPLPPGEHAVRLKVVTGPSGTALALIPVYINGEGPFAFALDTGASHSLVDQEIATKLKLPVTGKPVKMSGVVSTGRADPVRVDRWRVGNGEGKDIELPPGILVAMDMPEDGSGVNLQGLLGSDVLSRFGSIQIDYRKQVLIFRPDK